MNKENIMPISMLKKYFSEITDIFKGINAHEFENFIFHLNEAYINERQIFVFGNGGSGANASHFCSDFNKGVSYGEKKKFKIICLNDNVAIISSYANDISYDQIFVEQLKNFLNKNDLVIGVSGSGNSGNVLNALHYANEIGAYTFGICGFDGGELKKTASKTIVINGTDMQKIEDLQMMVFHCAMQWFNRGISTFEKGEML